LTGIQGLPPLSEAIGTWQERPEFAYLRAHFAGTAPSRTAAAGASGARRRTVGEVVSAALAVVGFLQHLVRCALLPKQKVLIFNLSSRVRRTVGAPLPLYLSPSLDLTGCIVAEEGLDCPAPSSSPMRFDARVVSRAGEVCGALLYKVYGLTGRPRDLYLFRFYVTMQLWLWTFRLLRPRGLKLYVWYSKMAQIAAARATGIPTFDVQHGVIYGDHPFYARPPADGGERVLAPDKFSVYGAYWREKLLAAGWSDQDVDIGGYSLDRSAQRPAPLVHPYVLYTSQPGYAGRIMRHIAAIVGEARVRGWGIVVAPHPMEDVTVYDGIRASDICVGGADSYDLLRHCAVHVSVSSTLLWEAMLFDKPSYMLDFDLAPLDTLQDLKRFGFARSLGESEFPAPFEIPSEPPRDHFFRSRVTAAATLSME
jgi:hypothetical protein